jgi:hypothetical protein
MSIAVLLGFVMAGLAPAIHVFIVTASKTWNPAQERA